MGVHGWSWLLKERGFLPDKSKIPCCGCSPWRDASTTDTTDVFTSRLVAIPNGSELHVDGNGLAFILHRVAYARHVANVLGNSNAKYKELMNGHHKSPCSLKKKLSTLSASQARRLLPNFMPMKLLSDVAREFVVQLRDKHQMQIKVYWDGEKRRVFKAATDEKRQEAQPEEWSNLHMYCENGVLPPVTKACELETLFPKCRFFKSELTEIFHQCKITQVICDEEADSEMARGAAGNPRAYIVGQDSDFCFFPDVNYIPVNTLDASSSSSSTVTGVVIRRDDLARELELPDEMAMVELAILMGNDYVDPMTAKWNHPATEISKSAGFHPILEFLKDQGSGFRVTSPSEETEEALLFIRTLYQLESLEEYELHDRKDQSHLVDDYDDEDAAGDVIVDPTSRVPKWYRPSVPDEVPVELLAMDIRLDRSPRDAVVRCLQAYVDMLHSTNEMEQPMIAQEHLDVLKNMPLSSSSNGQQQHPNNSTAQTVDWRPNWKDIPAAYLIEKMISMVLEQTTPLAHVSLPSGLFDQQLFFEYMNETRNTLPQNDDAVENAASASVPAPLDMGENQILPIDEHEDAILENIANNRVTIIKGETGCGKSSRIPVMVLKAPPPDPTMKQTRIFICQPRRIAAKGLVERVRSVEPELGKLFALRLGHGVREYESAQTRAWFCTTGYLVRLLANHPEKFDNISHLIIDEIHDRGVDLDLLCLLCRRLLGTNTRIRLVLMSATLAAALYQEYFDVPQPPIEVGARRFPVEEVYLDDLKDNRLPLSQKAQTTARTLASECDRFKCRLTPSMSYMDKLESLAASIISSVGKGGTSILVFVPGMNEIVAIVELIEQQFVPGITFVTIPVHSDIPFEDQLSVFTQTKSDECRVIVATNSAESSLTLPALDHVIDLGLCRQIVYNEASHRQMLTSAWISRASATQRAGRTGRIRKGTVYRLYTRNCYKNHMEAFEPGEMLRIPLDSVILMLKGILPDEESATKVLLECLEPPNYATIARSFQSLFESRYISSPDDEGEISNLGTFVSALGTDLSLGSLIGLGIQFGVGPEAIHLAAALSFPAKPWIISNRMIHGEAEFNKMSAKTYVSRCHFDSNLFSEPFSMMNLVWDYDRASNKQSWCWKYALALGRAKRLSSTCWNLQRRVADLLEVKPEYLDVEAPPRSMPPGKLAILRAIQVWVFHDTMIEWKPKKKIENPSTKEFIIPLKNDSDSIREEHIHQILIKERHPFELRVVRLVEQEAQFNPMHPFDESTENFLEGFEERLISYAIEKDISFLCVWLKQTILAFISTAASPEATTLEAIMAKSLGSSGLVSGIEVTGNARGIAERACGKWKLVGSSGKKEGPHTYRKFSTTGLKAKQCKSFMQDLKNLLETKQTLKSVCIQLNVQKRKGFDSYGFSSTCLGKQAEGFSSKDLRDIFGSLEDIKPNTKEIARRQELAFPIVPSGPWNPGEKNGAGTADAWPRPLLESLPEAARVVVAVASTQRKHRIVWLEPLEDGVESKSDKANREEDEENLLCMHPDSQKWGGWSRVSGSMVYLPDLTVPASALPLDGVTVLQCCCANALEIRGGALKVEGLTLLPPGRPFSLLCYLSFGLDKIDDEDDAMSKFSRMGSDGGPLKGDGRSKLLERCMKAQALNDMARHLGEELVCEPPCVLGLLEIFDGLWGEEIKPWPGLNQNPFTASNLMKSKIKRASTPARQNSQRQQADYTSEEAKDDIRPTAAKTKKKKNSKQSEQSSAVVETSRVGDGRNSTPKKENVTPKKENVTPKKGKKKEAPTATHWLILSEPEQIALPANISQLFATDLEQGKEVGVDELPSPNILCLVIQKYTNKKTQMRFDGHKTNWNLFRVTDGTTDYFQARFIAVNLAPSITKTGGGSLPQWIRKKKSASARPSSLDEVLECVPSTSSAKLLTESMEGKDGVFFKSIDTAIRVECALWLEVQFRVASKHWYQMSIVEMVQMLQKEMNDRKKKKKAAQTKLKQSASSGSLEANAV